MKKSYFKIWLGGIVIGLFVGALVGGFTVATMMTATIYKLSIAKPVCNLSGQIITK